MIGRATSREAADAIAPTAALLRGRVLAAITNSAGMTADETAEALGLSVLTVRPRCTELVRLGKIRDSGIRRRNISGARATVWIASMTEISNGRPFSLGQSN